MATRKIWQPWKPFTRDAINHFAPETAGVYELTDKRGKTQYFGKSESSVKSRLLLHTKYTKFTIVTHFRYKLVDYPYEAKDIEKKLITEYKSKHNGKLPPLNEVTPRKESTAFERYYQR